MFALLVVTENQHPVFSRFCRGRIELFAVCLIISNFEIIDSFAGGRKRFCRSVTGHIRLLYRQLIAQVRTFDDGDFFSLISDCRNTIFIA